MFRIKKLDIFITKQFCLLFVGTFFVCLFVLMMQFLWRYIDELIGKGLSMEVMAQFFWYMALMLIPQALPLAILLSSLITYGNLGESSELTAIKAAGISLMQSFRSLIFLTILIMLGSFYFQNVIGPKANMSFAQLLISMKQKSPELEIPEGIFYDGIPKTNLYVQKKDTKTGMLYGMMIYRMTDSFEDAAIILADSGMLQSTAEKKHLLLTLYSGEWFENMKATGLTVPYRRETFAQKRIVLDFDADFNMTDVGVLANNAKGKSLQQIRNDVDSLNHEYDSIGRAFYQDAKRAFYTTGSLSKQDSLRAVKMAATKSFNIDTVINRLSADERQRAMSLSRNKIQTEKQNMEFKSLITSEGDRVIRSHHIWAIDKFTLSLSCLLFFFI
jgi:lipopolysaccharide export system permease protein